MADNYGFEPKWTIDTIVTALGFSFACLSFYLQGRHEARDKKRDTYQKLELASIDLFRFEVANPAVVDGLNIRGGLPAEGTAARKAVESYVYQILNLFEMAVRFREEDVMPPDVFGSWVIWFHDLCCAENFPLLWPDMQLNYLPDLRRIMTEGIRLVAGNECEATRAQFFALVAEQVCDPTIRNWLTRAQ
jgi:hypothetical protein